MSKVFAFILGILSSSHWQDMQQWSTERDLDELDRCFDAADTSDKHRDLSEVLQPNSIDYLEYDQDQMVCHPHVVLSNIASQSPVTIYLSIFLHASNTSIPRSS
jgi:hypothetical protein